MESFNQHPDAGIITSFPGLGPLTGARVLAETGDDRSRFADARGLKAYAGAAPVTRASGKTTPSCTAGSRTSASPPPATSGPSPPSPPHPAPAPTTTAAGQAGDRHAAAQRNLFGRLLGCLHHCLATGQHYDEATAFPNAAEVKRPEAA